MNVQKPMQLTTTASVETRSQHGYLRFGWLALVVLQLASFVPLLPDYLPLARHPCPANCLLTIQEAQSLTRAGISPILYVGALLIVTVVNLVVSTAIAVILIARRSSDFMALFTAYLVLVLPTTQVLNLAPIKTSAIQTTAFSLPPALDLAIGLLQGSVIYGVFLLSPMAALYRARPGCSCPAFSPSRWCLRFGLTGRACSFWDGRSSFGARLPVSATATGVSRHRQSASK